MYNEKAKRLFWIILRNKPYIQYYPCDRLGVRSGAKIQRGGVYCLCREGAVRLRYLANRYRVDDTP